MGSMTSNEEGLMELYEEAFTVAEGSGEGTEEVSDEDKEKRAKLMQKGKRLAGEYAGHWTAM